MSPPANTIGAAELDEGGRRLLSSTPAELVTVAWLMRGLSNGEIAIVLAIAEQTIKNRMRDLMDRAGVDSRLRLALFIADRPELRRILEAEISADAKDEK